ncbi:MAG: type II toxin-antitoxin system RelE/ParE family toxin [Nostocaceae cyanobacterium]|nr:type II toxin-antitoxin system RelE/ParE family toxin [Nostocaceae cyanobacterium]
MKYKIRLNSPAERDFGNLTPDLQRAVATIISSLEENPRSPKVKKLRHNQNLYRIPFKRHYRIIFKIDDESGVVLIIRIRHRSEAYRGL